MCNAPSETNQSKQTTLCRFLSRLGFTPFSIIFQSAFCALALLLPAHIVFVFTIQAFTDSNELHKHCKQRPVLTKCGFILCPLCCVSPPMCVCVCQDRAYELRLLSRRGELLSEPSPSVNVSTIGRYLRTTLTPYPTLPILLQQSPIPNPIPILHFPVPALEPN